MSQTNVKSTPAEPGFKKACMRDRIRDALVERILDGKYPAGTQLKELQLAREFNVSQAPIREALRELEGSGLVESERYRGTRVRGADAEEMMQSYELRTILEARALELGMPFASDVIAELDESLRIMRTAAGKDTERYIHESLLFHRRIVDASGNRVFTTVWDSLHFDIRGRIALRRMMERGDRFGAMLDMHAELLERVRSREVIEAQRLLRGIFEAVARAFVPVAGS